MEKDDVLMAAHEKLSELHSGILFINPFVKKIQLALALVEQNLMR